MTKQKNIKGKRKKKENDQEHKKKTYKNDTDI